MTQKESDKLMQHLDTYFGQTDCTILHPMIHMDPHIDGLLYEPNEKFPYWKLVTMGASDYKMPVRKNTLGNRNEYIMFIDSSENMTDPAVANWYYRHLLEVAFYAIDQKTFISYCHCVEWGTRDGEEMVSVFLELPQVIADAGILYCKLGLVKTAVCLQVILLNRAETDKLLSIGPEQFSDYLYPERGRGHFICERRRSDKF